MNARNILILKNNYVANITGLTQLMIFNAPEAYYVLFAGLSANKKQY